MKLNNFLNNKLNHVVLDALCVKLKELNRTKNNLDVALDLIQKLHRMYNHIEKKGNVERTMLYKKHLQQLSIKIGNERAKSINIERDINDKIQTLLDNTQNVLYDTLIGDILEYSGQQTDVKTPQFMLFMESLCVAYANLFRTTELLNIKEGLKEISGKFLNTKDEIRTKAIYIIFLYCIMERKRSFLTVFLTEKNKISIYKNYLLEYDNYIKYLLAELQKQYICLYDTYETYAINDYKTITAPYRDMLLLPFKQFFFADFATEDEFKEQIKREKNIIKSIIEDN